MKRCGGCDRDLAPEAFAKDRTKRDGLQTHCRECNAARDAARYAERRATGLCTSCPALAVPGTALCPDHTAAKRARNAARYAADPEAHNAGSAAAKRRAYAAARAEGRCVWRSGRGCQSPAAEGRVLCPAHRAEAAERRARHTARAMAAICAEWEDLDAFRCWLCEGDILPGDEMHRDHIVPERHEGPAFCATTGAAMLRPSHGWCNVSRQDEHILSALDRLHPAFMTEGAAQCV